MDVDGGRFIVTWNDVGYYDQHVDKLNSFQVILTDRGDVAAGDFDVEYRYNRCEWTTGDATCEDDNDDGTCGQDGLGGVPAQVGFDAGNEEDFFAIGVSMSADVLQVCCTSNVGTPGVWRFEVRSGEVEAADAGEGEGEGEGEPDEGGEGEGEVLDPGEGEGEGEVVDQGPVSCEEGGPAELIDGLGGASDFGADSLTPVLPDTCGVRYECGFAGDDGSTADAVDISAAFPDGLAFFGETYDSVFINVNGNITFSEPYPVFVNEAFPVADLPMIAPFWADVDLTAVDPAIDNSVWWAVDADGGEFIVTWNEVGRFDARSDLVNSFQMILSAAQGGALGNFNVEFRYNRCEWHTGDIEGSLPAQIGFDAGDSENYRELPMSRTEDVLQVCCDSNVDEPGVWRFEVRDGIPVGDDLGAGEGEGEGEPGGEGGEGEGEGEGEIPGSGGEGEGEAPVTEGEGEGPSTEGEGEVEGEGGRGIGDGRDGEELGEYSLGGGGLCATAPSDGPRGAGATPLLLLLLAVGLGLRRRPFRLGGSWGLAVLATLVLAPSVAQAKGGFRVQRFAPAPGAHDYLGLHGADPGEAGRLTVGLHLNWADDLFVAYDSDGEVLDRLVDSALTTDVVVSLGLWDSVQLSVAAPYVLHQRSGDLRWILRPGEELAEAGGGDLRLTGKWRALGDGDGGLSVALLTEVALPTGREEDYQGEGKATIWPAAVVEIGERDGFRIGANVGFLVREEEDPIADLEVGNELTFGGGIAIPLGETPYTLLAEAQGATALAEELGTEEAPLEARGGVRWHSEDRQLTIDVGAGASLFQGYGAPDARVLTGLRWSPSLPTAAAPVAQPTCGDADADKDGVTDCCDACPKEAEDKDGWQDADGCPDPDNDGDKVPDVSDKCPLVPEDADGFEDADGCPDLDDDKDGIPDTMDKCRLVPEDLDKWDDLDGCPEADNDKDGFKDPKDSCPNEPETFNGNEDEDGCPDGEKLVELTAERIDIKDVVYFKTASAQLSPKSNRLLASIAAILKVHTVITKVRVEGHTDDRQSAEKNLVLSQRRSESVVNALVAAGVAKDRLAPKGFGESQPIVDIKGLKGEALKKARAKNRRVVFYIAARSDGAEAGTAPTAPDDLRKAKGVDAGKADAPKADR